MFVITYKTKKYITLLSVGNLDLNHVHIMYIKYVKGVPD